MFCLKCFLAFSRVAFIDDKNRIENSKAVKVKAVKSRKGSKTLQKVLLMSLLFFWRYYQDRRALKQV